MEKVNFRFYIQVRQFLGFDALSIWNDLNLFAGDEAPSLRTVQRWCKSFKDGRQDIEDLSRLGRPIVETLPPNIDLVSNAIEQDPYITYDELEAETSLSRGTLERIIQDHLKLKKITSRWVPHELSAKNRQDRVRICQENLAMFEENKWRLYDVVTGDESWFYHRQIGRKQSNASWVAEGESPRTVVRQGHFEPKTMFSIFFKSNGVVHVSYLDKGKTIDQHSYLNDCLKPLVTSLNKQRPTICTKNMKVHHDNAKPHVAKSVITYLESQNFIIMDHPSYSPDLSLSDFWFIDYIKQRLDDNPNTESLASQIVEIVETIPHQEYIKTFNKWLERMTLCVENKGDYFEHLKNKI